MGGVNITLANGQLGSALQTNDGVAGLVVTGTGEGDFEVAVPKLITSYEECVAGDNLTIATNAFALKQIREFYLMAGRGAQLYVILVPPNNVMSELCIEDDLVGQLLAYAGGKIRLLGVVTDDPAIADARETETVVDSGISDDVHSCLTALKALANTYASAQKPFRAIVGGTSYGNLAGDLTDITEGTTNNRCAVVIGDTETGDGACVGLLLGLAASLPVQRKVSRVKNEALPINAAYLGSQEMAALVSPGEPAVIAEKGYITFVKYPNVAGYFFSHDGTASATTDDYHPLVHGRVIDKAQVIGYATAIQEVDDEVPVIAGGKPDPGYIKALEQKLINALKVTMLENGEVSDIRCYINPEQNIVSTGQLKITLSVVPDGYATFIEIDLGLTL